MLEKKIKINQPTIFIIIILVLIYLYHIGFFEIMKTALDGFLIALGVLKDLN